MTRHVVAVRARISEGTPRDLRGVELPGVRGTRGLVLGIELTAFQTDDDEAARSELAERLLDVLGSAL